MYVFKFIYFFIIKFILFLLLNYATFIVFHLQNSGDKGRPGMHAVEPYKRREKLRRVFHLSQLIRELGHDCRAKGLSVKIGDEVGVL